MVRLRILQKAHINCSHSDRDAGGLDLCGRLSLEAAWSGPGSGAAVLSFQDKHKLTCWDSTKCHQEIVVS